MENTTDIWGAFLRTASVLIFVIALLLLFLYLLKRFSSFATVKSEYEMIKVLAVHHFSPKEKIVLVDVMDKKMLIGVTAQSINSLGVIESGDGNNICRNSEPHSSTEPSLSGKFSLLKDSASGEKYHEE
ncbi:hypothetical protein MTBBW1_1730046 [Desulfamplus magnetovallimortis]|uniref:Flagellar protein n=1 Tax=Desulfamplus magnetovallimortis TaxID=1246637 RepID=A0A1W1HA39_9BACT|nr:flagellar biosynthetic protein FliO [Desulfamplus magnetovallimortis]SLM29248.1 hypothetical protein MTBBW1_1730046 [Desulfamplus magnetovallimortis]